MSELVDQESVQIWMRIGSFERKVNSFVFAVLSRLTEWRDLPTCSDLSIRLPRCLPICEAAREAVDKDWYSSIINNSQARCQFGGGVYLPMFSGVDVPASLQWPFFRLPHPISDQTAEMDTFFQTTRSTHNLALPSAILKKKR